MTDELLFINANWLDVHTGSIHKGNIRIRGGRIIEFTESTKSDGKVIDCTGKYLTPGIIDAHVHLVWDGRSPDPMSATVKDGDYICFARGARGALMSLQAGVTTVRDVGCNDDCTLPLAKAIRDGILKGCTVIPAGSATQGSYGHCPMIGAIADTDAELIKRIKKLKGYHIEMQTPPVHWAKIMASGGAAGLEDVGPCMYSPHELETLVYEAHRLNMKVGAHALSYDAISKCVDAGIDTIEHGADLTEEILIKMKENGQCWVPTLAVYQELAASRDVVDDIIVDKSIAVTKKQREAFRLAMKIGTKIILGSDAGSANFGPHPSAMKEMLAMQEYGMDPADVIRSATSLSAQELGIGDQRGSLDVGKYADILVLDRNPLEDLHAFTDSLSQVYKEGVPV